MTMHEFDTEIGDYAEGTLPRDRVAAVEAHLASCDRCRAMAADFTTLRTTAAGLERRNPPPEVWTRLAATLAAPQHSAAGWRGRFGLAGARPALAAGIMVTLIMAATWLAWRDAANDRPSAPVSVSEGDGPDATGPRPVDNLAEAEIRDQISQIEPLADPAFLPGDAKPSFEGALAVVDDVIVQADAVRQEDPYNELAQQSLFEALRSKLTLLQDMLELINEMRKGNQEGTARIVSEMEP